MEAGPGLFFSWVRWPSLTLSSTSCPAAESTLHHHHCLLVDEGCLAEDAQLVKV